MRYLHIAAAVACLAAAGCSKPADDKAASAAAPPVVSDAQKQAALAALPAPYNTGDLINGKRQFALCRSCHTITDGGPDMTGPNLYGVFGRAAGHKPGYAYSAAVQAAGFTWDAEHLDGWLADPRGFMPGTKMTFAGVKDAKNRTDLIAFLKVETGYKPGS